MSCFGPKLSFEERLVKDPVKTLNRFFKKCDLTATATPESDVQCDLVSKALQNYLLHLKIKSVKKIFSADIFNCVTQNLKRLHYLILFLGSDKRDMLYTVLDAKYPKLGKNESEEDTQLYGQWKKFNDKLPNRERRRLLKEIADVLKDMVSNPNYSGEQQEQVSDVKDVDTRVTAGEHQEQDSDEESVDTRVTSDEQQEQDSDEESIGMLVTVGEQQDQDLDEEVVNTLATLDDAVTTEAPVSVL